MSTRFRSEAEGETATAAKPYGTVNNSQSKGAPNTLDGTLHPPGSAQSTPPIASVAAARAADAPRLHRLARIPLEHKATKHTATTNAPTEPSMGRGSVEAALTLQMTYSRTAVAGPANAPPMTAVAVQPGS